MAGEQRAAGQVTNGEALKNVEPMILSAILTDHPEYTEDTIVDFRTLVDYRLRFLEEMICSDSEQLSDLNREVIKSIRANESIADGNLSSPEKLSAGQKAADKLAQFGGSWPFIIAFIIILLLWISVNTVALFGKNFDPYPFILLNLVLSCLAAIQAPIIMMSQNRQAERDRQREVNDYKINLKAEIEVKLLHDKIDYLLEKPWNHLMEVQTMQVELIQQLQEEVNEMRHPNAETN